MTKPPEQAGKGQAAMKKKEKMELIGRRIQTCSIQRKIGSAGRDGDGTCMGFGSGISDEPLEKCKRCIACTSYERKE